LALFPPILIETYSSLESQNFFVGHGISLGNDGNQVDLRMKSAHHLDVKWLQGVTSWLDEVNTELYPVINNVHSVDFVLGIQVCIKSLLNIVNDWSPRLVVIDEVAKAWGINNI